MDFELIEAQHLFGLIYTDRNDPTNVGCLFPQALFDSFDDLILQGANHRAK